MRGRSRLVRPGGAGSRFSAGLGGPGYGSPDPREVRLENRGSRSRSVVLDLDGVLMGSREAHARSWADALRARGITVPLERIRPLIGMDPNLLLTRLTGIPLDSPLGSRVREARALLFRLDHLEGLRGLPRTRELFELMRSRSLRIAVTFSMPRADLMRALEVTGLGGLTDLEVGIDDASPAASPVEAAIERLYARREDCIALGDNPYVLAAAANARAPAIALRSGGWDDAALTTALAIYDDPADLLERFHESPLMDGDSMGGDAWRA